MGEKHKNDWKKAAIIVMVAILSLVNNEGYSQQTDVDSSQINYLRPLALKTNLLYDVVLAINLELEVPLGARTSLNLEWIFPWWLGQKKQRSRELLYGGAEFRYWLKPEFMLNNRTLHGRNPLTGWFIGGYYGMGLYDIESNKKGYQGESSLSIGVVGGFSQAISGSFSMEFSLGAGYLNTNYRAYNAMQDTAGDWHLIRDHSGNYSYFGITKAKISLVFYPSFKKYIK